MRPNQRPPRDTGPKTEGANALEQPNRRRRKYAYRVTARDGDGKPRGRPVIIDTDDPIGAYLDRVVEDLRYVTDLQRQHGFGAKLPHGSVRIEFEQYPDIALEASW